jgi:hypothetical protein
LCVDYEFTITDKNKLADLISKLLMGWSRHVGRLIRDLDPNYPNADKATIESQIKALEDNDTAKIDGWLFQMISWIVLAEQYKGERFLQHCPHPQKAMHGFDGLAVVLNANDGIESIIITEDKCTKNPRKKITEEVFPEFVEIEEGFKNNAIMQYIGALLSDDVLSKVQNDITNPKYRKYRISITRLKDHDSDAGRKSLFKGYDQKVSEADVNRRTCSSTNFDNMRAWMDDLRKKVIASLNQQKP